MATASRARLLLAGTVFACAGALLLAPGGQAQVLPPLPPLPSLTPSPAPVAPPSPTAVPGLYVPVPSASPACTPSASVPNSPPSCAPGSEPSVPAPACSLPSLQPGQFRIVDSLTPSPEWWWGGSLAVDPSNPCHLYTTGNTESAKGALIGFPTTVYRGDVTSSGTAWHSVFTMPGEPEDSAPRSYGPVNAAPEVTNPPLKQSAPVVGPNGTVWLAGTTAERLHLTRVFRSGDTGWHWSEKDDGLVAQNPTAGWSQAFVAPSDPNVVYVLTVDDAADGASVLHITVDDGATWSTSPLPGPSTSIGGGPRAPLMVDPNDPRTLYYLPNSESPLWVSRDAGSSWTAQQPQAPNSPQLQLPPGDVNNSLAVHQPGHPSVLYVHIIGNDVNSAGFSPPDTNGSLDSFFASGHMPNPVPVLPTIPGIPATTVLRGANGWYSTTDLGASWKQLPLPPDSADHDPATTACFRPCARDTSVPGSFLAVDPNNPNIIVWSDGGTGENSPGLELRITTDAFAGSPMYRVFVPRLGDSTGMTVDSLQTDARGDFFLALDRCSNCTAQSGNGNQYGAAYAAAATVLAFRPPSGQSGAPITFTLGGSVLQASTPPSNPYDSNHPPPEPAQQVGESCAVATGQAGSLAFDGRYVDYTQDETSEGTIFRLDAAGCTPVPALTLNSADFPLGKLPDLVSLTFDARYAWPDGRVGALLGSAPAGSDPRVPITNVPIYAIDPLTARSVLLWNVDTASAQCNTGFGTYAFGADSPAVGLTGNTQAPYACPDNSFFSYDVFRKGLWSLGTPAGPSDPRYDPHPGYLSPDNTFHDNCLSTLQNIGAATVGGNGYLYALWEDDATVLKLAADSCQIVGGFRMATLGGVPHTVGENPREEEQIACDPLSFSTPVIWVRDSQDTAAAEYPTPDAVCPFVTRLSYSGPTGQVLPGRAMTLCYTLEAALDSIWQPVVGQPVKIRVGGFDLGHPLTDQSGRACLTKPAPSTFGSAQVVGDFGGTAAYLPVSLTDGIDVPGGHGGPIAIGVGEVPTVPPPSGPQSPADAGSQVQANAGSESVLQAQMQAQLQTQAQTQSVAQAQPGVVMQRQRKVQLATQEQGAQTNVAYEATALRHSRPAPAVALAAALMMLGGALAWRRPRVAVSRATRGRRRPRA